ncbi:MAG: DUF4157 domain-containing protein [Deltaproteobacteria bacterium]|nr:MAG: DUF4157 domain-containing protein [Deltaproteobacteria bacterium]
MMHLLHPPRRDRDEPDRFDHAAEGARYGLARDLSRMIWQRARADATDAAGRTDLEDALRRFQAIAVRLAARGGRLQPDVGRLTRVGVELDGDTAFAPGTDAMALRAPGRETLVAVEAWRWEQPRREVAKPHEVAEPREVAVAAEGSGRHEGARGQSELPGADAVRQAMAGLLSTTRIAQAEPAEQRRARGSAAFDGAAAAGRQDALGAELGTGAAAAGYDDGPATARPADVLRAERRAGAATARYAAGPALAVAGTTGPARAFTRPLAYWPGAGAAISSPGGTALPFRDHFERALGLDLGIVSARFGRDELRPLGARAATRGAHIDFFDERPSRELVGHELVHVLQNLRTGASSHGVSARGDDDEREAEALGQDLAAGQFVAPRARPSAALQLGREENLNLQWQLEEKLKKRFPKAAFISEAKRLFALIQDRVPSLDAAAKAEQVWMGTMKSFYTLAIANDNLDQETDAYTEVLRGLEDDVAARLTLASDEEVTERAATWPKLSEFWPQATPFVLLQKLSERVTENYAAFKSLARSVPKESDHRKAMQDTWDQARELDPGLAATGVAETATGARDKAIATVRTEVASVSPASRVAVYAAAMDEIAQRMKATLTPPKPADVVQRVRAIANTPALAGMAPVDALDPDFAANAELRQANAELRARYLAGLPERYPKDRFVAAVLALYPKIASRSEAVRTDAAALHDEEMARLRALVERQSLGMDRDEYRQTLVQIEMLSAQPAFDIPVVPRRYHSNTADDSEDLQVHGAEPAEAECIKKYLSSVRLAKNSEHRLIAPIGPAPENDAPAPRGRLLVSVDHEGHAIARLVARAPRTGDEIENSAEATAELQATLTERFGLAGFEAEGGAAWTTSDMHKLDRALARVPAEDHAAVRGLTFVRAKNLDKAENEGRTLGLFTVRLVGRRIKLADVAFQGDQFAFTGTRAAVASSGQVVLHEVAHAIEHQPQLDAQLRLSEVERSAPQGRLFNDDLDELEKAQPESIASELLGPIVLISATLLEKPKTDARAAVMRFVNSVQGVLADVGKDQREACDAAWKQVAEQKEAVATMLSEDDLRRLAALKAGVIKYVKAVQNAPTLREQLRRGEEDLAKKEEAHRVALEQARKAVAAETSEQDGKRSRRLQSFIDFVVEWQIPPTITAYAESSWKSEKYGEFFAEAYALWLSDPQFLRRNFQPLYVYFKNGKHRG